MTTARPTRILILGGGFGGVYTALNLEKILKRELTRGEVEIALVSRDNYLTFQPMLPEVVSGSIGILDTITPIRRLCPRTNLYTRAIEEVDLEFAQRLLMDAGTGEASPPTAQHATREGRCAAEKIAATIRGSAKRASPSG